MQVKFLNQKSKLKAAFWLLLVLAVINPIEAFAKISQSIDRTDIHAGETFVLTIELDKDTGAEPDLSMIPKDFTIISTDQYAQIVNINGRVQTSKSWNIQLSTLKTGKLVIPPISVGNESTQAIMLFIKDTDSQVDLGGESKIIFLETDVSAEEVYVQQQIIYTIKLYRSVNTHRAKLSPLVAGDSIVEKLGDDVQYYKNINNKRYLVAKIRYAIFPQKSGKLTIDPILFTADINDPNANQNSFRYLSTTRPISIKSKALEITVKPKPTNASEPWMPSSDLVLEDTISSDNLEFTLGEPLTWTIKLSAQGLSESQIADIKFPSVKGLQFYPDTPQKEREINAKGIRGQKIEKVAVVPSQEGEFELPEIKVFWWDIKEDKEKTAIIPARKISVKAPINQPSKDQKPEVISPIQPQETSIAPPENTYWRYLTAIFAFLWLLTLIAWYRAKSNLPLEKNKPEKGSKASKNKANRNQSLSLLNEAIKQQDLKKIEKYLLLWAGQVAQSSFYSIGQLQSKLADQQVCDKLALLESLRYGAPSKSAQCDLSQQDLADIQSQLVKNTKSAHQSKDELTAIPPLYR